MTTPAMYSIKSPKAACKKWAFHAIDANSFSLTAMERVMMPSRGIALIAAALLVSAIGCTDARAQAQNWPQRTVRIIAPYAAGGNSDVITRLTAQRLSDAFGQTFVVENRLGGNGAVAAEAAARSPADGYTLLWGVTPPITINPAMTKVNYDPIKDFAPISVVGVNGFVL